MKTDGHNITDILFKVALNTTTLIQTPQKKNFLMVNSKTFIKEHHSFKKKYSKNTTQ
jgi:hypothetical protein